MKSLKFIFCNIVLCVVIFQPAMGKVVKVGTTPVKINEGESFRLIYTDGGSVINWIVQEDDNNVSTPIAGSDHSRNTQNLILEGPGWLLGSYNSYHATLTYATVEILPSDSFAKYFPGGGGSSSSSSASGEQKNVTVIPENTPSNVQITLEQSTDLVNWSVVQPGSFAPSTTKRFFRIRSEQE